MQESQPKSMHKKRVVVQRKLELSFLLLFCRITFLRSFMKWILRKITGMCELQRIVRNYDCSERTLRLESCLLMSKNQTLQDVINDETLLEVEQAVTEIMRIKSIIPETDPVFEDTLIICLTQIRGYRILFDEIEDLRREPYDNDKEDHKKMLMKLWENLMPGEELENIISKDWCQIGFQGDDPKRDFRGMGMLGLRCLAHFAENHREKAKQLLQHSHHPTLGYSYAIVSINITSLVYEFFQSGYLRSHFFSVVQGRPTVSDFLHLFSCVFYQFDKFWIESKPENVMAFGRIRENFALQMMIHLEPPSYGCLKME